jgi:hypothetical protein
VTRAAACPVCGAPLPAGAAYCPGCGHASPGTWVTEAIDEGGVRDHEIVIGRKRRPRSPIALLAAILVLLAGIVIVSRDHGGDSSSATTTAPSTTLPSTTTTADAATTTTGQLSERVAPGPVLGQPTGLVVYLAVPRQDNEILYALDLDRGVFRELATMSHNEGELPVLGDAILIYDDASEMLVHPDGATKQLGDPANATFTTGRPDAYWKVSLDDELTASTAIFVVIGAPEQRAVSIPAGFHPFAGDGLGGLLVMGPDSRIYRLLPDSSTLVALDVSNTLASANGRVAAVACDDNLSCPIDVVDLTSGSRATIPGSAGKRGTSSLAPDGAHLSQIASTTDADRQALFVFDTTTGDTLLHVPYDGLSYQSGPPRWSPDSQWLFWTDVRGLEVWNVERIQPRTIDLPGTDRSSIHFVGVAATS